MFCKYFTYTSRSRLIFWVRLVLIGRGHVDRAKYVNRAKLIRRHEAMIIAGAHDSNRAFPCGGVITLRRRETVSDSLRDGLSWAVILKRLVFTLLAL
jgi:hypothetical protein